MPTACHLSHGAAGTDKQVLSSADEHVISEAALAINDAIIARAWLVRLPSTRFSREGEGS